MKHKQAPILELHIETDPAGTVALCGELGSVRMIPFRGTATGPVFQGIVEPCGVDTQIVDRGGVRHMSARYMLTGRDADGRDCRIYVQNHGQEADGAAPGPFRTVPVFMTDSPALAPILHTRHFVGEGQGDGSGLCIRFYELCGGGADC